MAVETVPQSNPSAAPLDLVPDHAKANAKVMAGEETGIQADVGTEDGFFDDMSFWDVLDVVNPLQHIPLLNYAYRGITGDEIKSGPRLLGGFLFGGPIGLAAAGASVFVDETTGKDPGEHLIAFVTGEDDAAGGGQGPNDLNVAQGNQPQSLVPDNFNQWASLYSQPGAGQEEGLQIAATQTRRLEAAALQGTGGAQVASAGGPVPMNALLGPGGTTVRPSGPSGQAIAAGTEGTTTVVGRAPQDLPLGYRALGGAQIAQATPAPADTARAAGQAAPQLASAAPDAAPRPAPTSTGTNPATNAPGAAGAGLPVNGQDANREFGGKSLSDYRARPVYGVSRRPAGALPNGAGTNPAPTTAGTGVRAGGIAGQPDPAIMAQLMEAERSGGQSFGPNPTQSAPGPSLTSSPGAATWSGGAAPAPSAGGISPQTPDLAPPPGTAVGDTLSVPDPVTNSVPGIGPAASIGPAGQGPSGQNRLSTPQTPATTSAAGAGAQPPAQKDLGPWFNNKVMDALEKYKKLQGGSPAPTHALEGFSA